MRVPNPLASGLMTSIGGETSYDSLAGAEPVFAALIYRYGRMDPFAFHDGGRTAGSLFAALFLHIVGQQISALVSFVVYDRVAELTGGPPTPETLLALGPGRLRGCGLSGAKAGYVIALSRMQMDGSIDVEDLSDLDDEEAIAALSRVPGVGRWTAQRGADGRAEADLSRPPKSLQTTAEMTAGLVGERRNSRGAGRR